MSNSCHDSSNPPEVSEQKLLTAGKTTRKKPRDIELPKADPFEEAVRLIEDALRIRISRK